MISGVVARTTWWKGTETMARETLDIAMLMVKRKEKASSDRFSRYVSLVVVKNPS